MVSELGSSAVQFNWPAKQRKRGEGERKRNKLVRGNNKLLERRRNFADGGKLDES